MEEGFSNEDEHGSGQLAHPCMSFLMSKRLSRSNSNTRETSTEPTHPPTLATSGTKLDGEFAFADKSIGGRRRLGREQGIKVRGTEAERLTSWSWRLFLLHPFT